VEAWTTIRYLHAQETPIRAICRELGVSRNAVRQALRSESAPKYERPPKPNPKLAPFEETWYFGQKLIGSRILRELAALGYTGHRSAVYRNLERLKAEKPSPKVIERCETPPGQQAQFDWSPYTIELGGELTRVIVFGMVLGYSRRKHYTASLDETQASIYEAIESCLRYFCGATRQLMVDSAKAFVRDANPTHSAGTRSSWSCAATIGCDLPPAGRIARGPKARWSGRSSTSSSSSSKAPSSRRSRTSWRNWEGSNARTYQAAEKRPLWLELALPAGWVGRIAWSHPRVRWRGCAGDVSRRQ
jgi:transposase